MTERILVSYRLLTGRHLLKGFKVCIKRCARLRLVLMVRQQSIVPPF